MALIDVLADAGRGFDAAAPHIFQKMSEERRIKAQQDTTQKWMNHYAKMQEKSQAAAIQAAQVQRDFTAEQNEIDRKFRSDQYNVERGHALEDRTHTEGRADAAAEAQRLIDEQTTKDTAKQQEFDNKLEIWDRQLKALQEAGGSASGGVVNIKRPKLINPSDIEKQHLDLSVNEGARYKGKVIDRKTGVVDRVEAGNIADAQNASNMDSYARQVEIAKFGQEVGIDTDQINALLAKLEELGAGTIPPIQTQQTQDVKKKAIQKEAEDPALNAVFDNYLTPKD